MWNNAVMKEKLSREAWTIIGLILLVNIVSVASSGFFSHPVSHWIHVLESFIIFIAAIFVVLEVRRQIRQKQSLRRTKGNGTV
jgi:hypothetical protein